MRVGTKLTFLVNGKSKYDCNGGFYRIAKYHNSGNKVVIREWEIPHRVIGHYDSKVLKHRFVEVVEIK